MIIGLAGRAYDAMIMTATECVPNGNLSLRALLIRLDKKTAAAVEGQPWDKRLLDHRLYPLALDIARRRHPTSDILPQAQLRCMCSATAGWAPSGRQQLGTLFGRVRTSRERINKQYLCGGSSVSYICDLRALGVS